MSYWDKEMDPERLKLRFKAMKSRAHGCLADGSFEAFERKLEAMAQALRRLTELREGKL